MVDCSPVDFVPSNETLAHGQSTTCTAPVLLAKTPARFKRKQIFYQSPALMLNMLDGRLSQQARTAQVASPTLRTIVLFPYE